MFSVYDTLFNLTFVAAAVVSVIVLPKTGKSYAAIVVITAGYAVTAAVFWSATVRQRRRGRGRSAEDVDHGDADPEVAGLDVLAGRSPAG